MALAFFVVSSNLTLSAKNRPPNGGLFFIAFWHRNYTPHLPTAPGAIAGGNGDKDKGNTVFTTTKPQNVTITFDTETKKINVVLSDATEPDPNPPTEPPVEPEKPNKPGKPDWGGIFDWIFWWK